MSSELTVRRVVTMHYVVRGLFVPGQFVRRTILSHKLTTNKECYLTVY